MVEQVIFFDNEIENCNAFKGCINITTIKVPELDQSNPIPYTDPSIEKFIGLLSPDAKIYMNKVVKIMLTNGEYYDEKSGLELDNDKLILENWLSLHEESRKAVIFDFDRTITKSESFLNANAPNPIELHGWNGFKSLIKHSIPSAELDDLTMNGWVEYYMGGHKRMEEIKQLFDIVYNAGAEIVILTKNESVKYNLELILDFVSVISRGRPIRIICSIDFPNKHACLSNVAGFAEVCKKMGSF